MIEFQYFESCPHSTESLKNLKKLIAEGFIAEDELIMTEVPDVAAAEKLNFQGSPTILYEGLDIYTGEIPVSFNYSCRIYIVNGIRTGMLPKDFIKKQIEELRKKTAG